MENIKITTYPVTSPLTLADAKAHLRILDTASDVEIEDYIDSSLMFLYRETNILIDASATGYIKSFKTFTIPIVEVDTLVIKYFDESENEQTLSTDDYRVTYGAYTSVEFINEPNISDREYPIKIEVTTLGSSDPMVVQCLRMLVADMFENRQSNEVGAVREVSRSTRWQLDLISKRFWL